MGDPGPAVNPVCAEAKAFSRTTAITSKQKRLSKVTVLGDIRFISYELKLP